MQLNMLEAMNIYVNVVEQGSFIRAAEVLELHRPAVSHVIVENSVVNNSLR
ncbi:LysR family transcriptional regulator [Salmonella enterica]|nr:LysR family transcriptional regulator [Salmonella enterica]EBF9490447.1 LysR family transcriptional regulator [Salmonella enterica subsp. enterica serovar Newport]EBG2769806.1 LysR family transcriptional regulator [Salmonella enterica subsp. enterica serovar Newport]EBG2978199.1 LysR family transcriptional regulator [Salmonella enterica subsp. enterica serovar Newport]EBW5133068.1 LysR family transcriptional regulator [Salmonella enterica subsp. enterica serovar Newport]